ncbi:hypothetical protein ATG98_3122 [Marinobacter sp. LV10R520-4]|uniref:DUF2066 domain-containing protein n=1 Tax=Marinobacter sp. LV10R520-4 TaxID=1761796 RepID=UPI000C012647|nr:DUF2066 domain-containing protein [Marinobacter sp. LV10R520-4]PFG53944.1 hypothetical protein ATG98_3122 [Marinobacter sp. LV10R520-4]
MPEFQKSSVSNVQRSIEFKALSEFFCNRVVNALARVRQSAVRWALAAMLLLAAQAQAVTVNNLYSANVALQGSGQEALSASYSAGLREVLVRVAGSRGVLEREGIDAVLGTAESMLTSYQVLSAGAESRVQMSFGAVAVTQALASIQAPVWGANRPLTLAWVALEEQGERALITDTGPLDGASAEFRSGLENASRVRGLPLVLPVAGAAGNRELLSDIWGQFVSRVRSTSNDIGRDVMALVRVSRSGDQWRAGWVMDGFSADSPGEQVVSADSPAALAQALVDRWTELYVSRYGASGGEAGKQPTVDLVLQGVTGLADYAEVTRALAQINAVDSAAPVEVKGSELTLRLTFSGELDQLREYIMLDSRLVSQPAAVGPSEEQALQALYPVLIYRWQPSPVPAVVR